MTALAEKPVQYGAKPFTSETARAAAIKGNETQQRLRLIAKAHQFVTEPSIKGASTRAAIADYRRTQRRMLLQARACTKSSEALEFVRAASMCFEMECTLTGRKIATGKAAKTRHSDELPLPMELPPSDLPPLDESTLPPLEPVPPD